MAKDLSKDKKIVLKPCSCSQVDSHGMPLDDAAVEGACLHRHLLLREPHVGRDAAALLVEFALDHRHLWLGWEDKDFLVIVLFEAGLLTFIQYFAIDHKIKSTESKKYLV